MPGIFYVQSTHAVPLNYNLSSSNFKHLFKRQVSTGNIPHYNATLRKARPDLLLSVTVKNKGMLLEKC